MGPCATANSVKAASAETALEYLMKSPPKLQQVGAAAADGPAWEMDTVQHQW